MSVLATPTVTRAPENEVPRLVLTSLRHPADHALVLTGVTTREQAEGAPPEQRPDRVLEDLRGLL